MTIYGLFLSSMDDECQVVYKIQDLWYTYIVCKISIWYISDYIYPHFDNDEILGDKTTICDCRAFRYDGHETFPCEGGGKYE